MRTVLAYAAKNFYGTQKLLEWIVALNPELRPHTLILVASSQMQPQHQKTLEEIAKKAFGKVDSIRQRQADERPWPDAQNTMFKLACKYVAQTYNEPFLWIEPDSIPLKPNWLDALHRQYESCGKLFMGAVWDKPRPHMNGIGFYPSGILYDGPDRVPFDVHLGTKNMGAVYDTHLIHHEWGDIPTNTPWTFPTAESVKRIRDNAVLFHRSKDGTLIDRLMEAKKLALPVPPPNGFFADIKKAVKGLLRNCSTYYHSGNLGDIIYALYAIKLAGGGDLVIGPEQNQTSPCSVPITRDQFNLLAPLLRKQPYLKSVEFSAKYPDKRMFDLNTFRNAWNDWNLRVQTKADTLCKMHCYVLGVLDDFSEVDPWLVLSQVIPTDRIVVHRSARYWGKFPWKELVASHGQKMLFTGTEPEHMRFCREFGAIAYWKPRDFVEMAALVAGAKCFVGNQSFPLSLALSVGQRAMVEEWEPSPDCRFNRTTYASKPVSEWLL